MGGAVKVILKKNDILYKQTRWTNTLPSFVVHDKFFEKNEAWWDAYVNQESRYSHPDDDFSPDGYGIIVLDFDSKRIISKQVYCSFATIELSGLFLWENGQIVGPDYADPDQYYPAVVKRMWEKGMLSVEYFSPKKEEGSGFLPDNSFDGKTWEEAWSIFINNDKRSFLHRGTEFLESTKFYNLKVNFGKIDWELYEFEIGSNAPWRTVLDCVKKFYTLTEEEVKNWDKWLEEDEEFDDEEELKVRIDGKKGNYTEPYYKFGSLMTVEEFKATVESGMIMDDDGSGNAVKDGLMDTEDLDIYLIPADATHVVWFNK